MSYIDSNLMSGESVIYRARLHWIVFAWPIIWLVIALFFLGAGGDAIVLAAIAFILAVWIGISALVAYLTSEFGITSKRVLIKVGFIRRNSLEVLLAKVEGIQVSQGILGRILGFGSIVIRGTGGTRDPFRKIAAPLEFRRRAQEQIAVVQEGR